MLTDKKKTKSSSSCDCEENEIGGLYTCLKVPEIYIALFGPRQQYIGVVGVSLGEAKGMHGTHIFPEAKQRVGG